MKQVIPIFCAVFMMHSICLAHDASADGSLKPLQLYDDPCAAYYRELEDLPSYDNSVLARAGTSPTFMSANPSFIASGNVVRVDASFGNDTYGARNGLPFLTITAALAAAKSGDVVRVYPGTYNESITIPTGITVSGFSQKSTIISRTVNTAITLVTMGTSSVLENVSLSLTATAGATQNCVVFAGTTNATAQIRFVTIIGQASTASATLTGINSTANGVPPTNWQNIQNCSVTVNATGTSGAAVGISVSSGQFNIFGSFITATSTSGTATGVVSSFASANGVVITNSVLSGQTNDLNASNSGSVKLSFSSLRNSSPTTATVFSSGVSPTLLQWGAINVPTLPGATFMRPGFQAASATRISMRMPRAAVLKNLSVKGSTGPVTSADTWTVHINGAAPSPTLIATCAVGQTTAADTTHAVIVAAGNLLSIEQAAHSAGAGTQNPLATVEMY